MRYPASLCRLIVSATLAVAVASPLAGQKASDPTFSIHGYLTQGYGFTSRDTVMGLTPQGTADYRRAAIVARYAPTSANAFVVQLGHRRLGDSPTMQFEENLKVDMAFYDHRFADGTSVRVGKSALPSGIFNEIRYVGTLLPFYRAPYSVYGEQTNTSETLDGIVASHRLRAGEPWELSTDLYAGSFDLLTFQAVVPASGPPIPTYQGLIMQSKNVFGGQFWLSTPIDGLRVGTGGRRMDMYGGGAVSPTNPRTRVTADVSASIDGHFEKWQFKAEADRAKAYDFLAQSKYVQLGITPVSRVSLNVQREYFDIHASPLPATTLLVNVNRDDAIGVNFMLDARTVLKVEQHRTNGFNIEQVFNPFGPRIQGSYFLTSISTSF
jgi:hypothetical protein